MQMNMTQLNKKRLMTAGSSLSNNIFIKNIIFI